jgi:hypothetical protein
LAQFAKLARNWAYAPVGSQQVWHAVVAIELQLAGCWSTGGFGFGVELPLDEEDELPLSAFGAAVDALSDVALR